MRKITWNTGRQYDELGQLIVAGLVDAGEGLSERWLMLDLSRGIEYLFDVVPSVAGDASTDYEVRTSIMRQYDEGKRDVYDERRYSDAWVPMVNVLKAYADRERAAARARLELEEAPKWDMDSDLMELREEAYQSDQRTGHVWVLADNTTQRVFALTLLAKNCIGTDWRMWGDVPEDLIIGGKTLRGGRFLVSEALRFWLYDGEATTNDEVEFDRHKLVVLAEKQFDGVTDHSQVFRKVFTTTWGRKIGA